MKKLIALALCLLAVDAEAKGGFSSSGGSRGFSSSRSYSAPAPKVYSAPKTYSAPAKTTTTTTTTRSSSHYSPPVNYGGFGSGYGFSNGIITGLVIGHLMHPQGTVVYGGGGYNGGAALLYPDGRVVNQQGYQVGTYNNGQFVAQQGEMVAQAAPEEVPVADNEDAFWKVVGTVVLVILAAFVVLVILF